MYVCRHTHTHTSPDIYTHTLGLTVRGCFFQGFQLNHSSLNVWEFPRIQINRLYNTRRAKFKRRNKKICKKCLTGQISKSIHFFNDTQDVRPLMKYFERHWIISKCVCVGRQGCVCVGSQSGLLSSVRHRSCTPFRLRV